MIYVEKLIRLGTYATVVFADTLNFNLSSTFEPLRHLARSTLFSTITCLSNSMNVYIWQQKTIEYAINHLVVHQYRASGLELVLINKSKNIDIILRPNRTRDNLKLTN